MIRTESKPRNMISGRHSERRPRSFVRAFQSGIPFLFEFAFYSIHIFKSRLEDVSFYGNLLFVLWTNRIDLTEYVNSDIH